ncbi:alpha/beta fold hydrolase [Rhodobacter ferrooxidans]|uniref:Alpha/beta hydrolase fold protein n=1 Tax=Rhodobacter ferrooxidans TaxID=371731 RepID=C8RYA2_9RHOB|nr:alpha/beta fold hydrolase [Rhodobacter sp. SW2]EEW26090.1 alpha/beta hydrolase fold protein [Rhodobacter sp. SW2]
MLHTLHHPAVTPQGNPPLLIAHGLFGSARNWGVIARRMADDREVLAVDMRNHGDSPRFATQGYAEMAADLAEVIVAHGGQADVLGHSMGGKAAMMLAVTAPHLVRRLVVADIAPVAYGHDRSNHVAAMLALPLDGLTTRGEADRRLAASIPDPALRAFFLQSLDLKAHPVRWRLNLPVLAAEMGKIVGWPNPQGRFDGPTLFVTGGLSDYVRAEHRPAILALFPKARFARITGAGHWLHADKPREFEETLRAFLNA